MSADSTLRKHVKAHLVAQHVPNSMYQGADSDGCGDMPPPLLPAAGSLTLYTIPMEEDASPSPTAAAATAGAAANATLYAVPMAEDAGAATAPAAQTHYAVPMQEDDGEYLAIGGSDGDIYHVPTDRTTCQQQQPVCATPADLVASTGGWNGATAAMAASTGIRLVQMYGEADNDSNDDDDVDGDDAGGASAGKNGDYIDANSLVAVLSNNSDV